MTSNQEKSELFWKNASNSHLASPDFYARKRHFISAILDKLPAMKAGLDIGCGNGEYTALLLPKTEKVVGYDLSPGLLEAARQTYAGEERMSFHQAAVDEIPEEKGAFDIVLCMGVTSCIIDDDKYHQLIRNIAGYVHENAFVLMGDTLSHTQNLILNDKSGYVAKYRDVNQYRETLKGEGLQLLSELKLMDAHGGKTANSLFLFWKPLSGG
ncbi:class I SAM-dependent methyltransferase [Rhizobium sp. FY34]|uniref:class I SAM-dependent methyltransferase n=1 Tax=Rhizobium sp. FY34 TaxID=2562309 RepID=UPI0010BF8DEF|nr:class I SAM-dependent methyltransferase [Rhizobium sp. FY34]